MTVLVLEQSIYLLHARHSLCSLITDSQQPYEADVVEHIFKEVIKTVICSESDMWKRQHWNPGFHDFKIFPLTLTVRRVWVLEEEKCS